MVNGLKKSNLLLWVATTLEILSRGRGTKKVKNRAGVGLLRKGLIFESRGVHPSETMMHFPLCFRFFPYFRKISESEENFHNFLIFIPRNFFSHRPQISNFPPIFPVSVI